MPLAVGFYYYEHGHPPTACQLVHDVISLTSQMGHTITTLHPQVSTGTRYHGACSHCFRDCCCAVQIAMEYAKGWFPLDFLATFPIHWFTNNLMSQSGSVGNLNRLLRMLRLFKLFRIIRLVKLFPKLFSALETSVKMDPALLRFLRSFIVLAFVWHLMGT